MAMKNITTIEGIKLKVIHRLLDIRPMPIVTTQNER